MKGLTEYALIFFLSLQGCHSTSHSISQSEREHSRKTVFRKANYEREQLKYNDCLILGDERFFHAKNEDKYWERFSQFCKGYPMPTKDQFMEYTEKHGLRSIIVDKDTKVIKQAGYLVEREIQKGDEVTKIKLLEFITWKDFFDMTQKNASP